MDEQTQQQCLDQLKHLHDARWLLDFQERHQVNVTRGAVVQVWCRGEHEFLIGTGPDLESALWDLSQRMQQRRNAA